MGTTRAENLKGGTVDALQGKSWDSAGWKTFRRFVEGVVERLPNSPLHALGAIDGQVAAKILGEDPQVIHAKEMVGVFMREEDRMNQPDPFADECVAEVRRRVDQEVAFGQSEHHAATAALVFWIRVHARRAAATDHRHAMRRSRAEEDELLINIAAAKLNAHRPIAAESSFFGPFPSVS